MTISLAEGWFPSLVAFVENESVLSMKMVVLNVRVM